VLLAAAVIEACALLTAADVASLQGGKPGKVRLRMTIGGDESKGVKLGKLRLLAGKVLARLAK
jgi:hypothetical protein